MHGASYDSCCFQPCASSSRPSAATSCTRACMGCPTATTPCSTAGYESTPRWSSARRASAEGAGLAAACTSSTDRSAAFSRTWDYPEDSKQFAGLSRGAALPVLLDPLHPTTVCTVRDVQRRTNTGLGPVLGLGVVFLAAGVAGGVWFVRVLLRRRTT